MNALGGLVTGVEVLRQEGDTMPIPPLPEPTRRLRMVLRQNPGSTPSRPYYGVTFSETDIDPEVPIGQSIGPTLLLNRGEPVSIMVHNRTLEATTIHWHGLEPPNYYDGVAGFSGIRPEVAPAIAPGDSFEVRLAPPRAGTYLYLAHTEEARQQRAGLLGAVIVTEAGRHDPAREMTIVVSSPSDSAEHATSVLVNGALQPQPAELRQGASYRMRLANATVSRRDLTVDLLQDSTLVTWRPVAKDGVELPAARRALRTATQRITIGETLDVEFFPTRPGDYRLELRDRGLLVGTLPILVR
jgi:FtsP/CotA-like multicopper oxidase with cupredoxin domain